MISKKEERNRSFDIVKEDLVFTFIIV